MTEKAITVRISWTKDKTSDQDLATWYWESLSYAGNKPKTLDSMRYLRMQHIATFSCTRTQYDKSCISTHLSKVIKCIKSKYFIPHEAWKTTAIFDDAPILAPKLNRSSSSSLANVFLQCYYRHKNQHEKCREISVFGACGFNMFQFISWSHLSKVPSLTTHLINPPILGNLLEWFQQNAQDLVVSHSQWSTKSRRDAAVLKCRNVQVRWPLTFQLRTLHFLCTSLLSIEIE